MASATVSSVDLSLMEEIDEQVPEDDVADTVETIAEDEVPKKRRRRRRRRRGGSDAENNEGLTENGANNVVPDDVPAVFLDAAAEAMNDEEKPKRRRRTRGGSKAKVAVSENDTAVEVLTPLAIATSETVASVAVKVTTEVASATL